MNILLADRQDITREGLIHVMRDLDGVCYEYVENKVEMTERLKANPCSVVVLDYTLFDINDTAELLIIAQRFKEAQWLLFSNELSVAFVRSVITSGNHFSIVMKDSSLPEIREALLFALRGQRYICQRMAELLLTPVPLACGKDLLTKTETEILKDIALGMTTREIADKRYSSFHTVNTHRKNIFRKIAVNTAYEATKYALRAGLIDAVEYYI